MVSKSQLVKKLGPLGLFRFARVLTRNQPRILMYHRFSNAAESGKVSSAEFDYQVRHIAEHYNPVRLTDLVRALRGEAELKPNSIVITVDDGYDDFYQVAYPVLKKYRVPATLFVTSRFVDGGFWLWPDKVTWMLKTMSALKGPVQLGSTVLNVGEWNDQQRRNAWNQIIGFLLTREDEEKHRWIDAFAESQGIDIPSSPVSDYSAVTWEQLREMQSDLVEIGGHTVSHPSLGRVTDEQLQQEIIGCKAALDENLGERDRPFCYPNGQPQDYTPKAKEIVAKSGFNSAVVAFYDDKRLEDTYELRRYTSSSDRFQFLKSVSGIELLASVYTKSHNKMAWHY